MQFHDHEHLRPSTIVGILIGLLAVGTASWIVVRAASDYQESAHPDQSAAAFVDPLQAEPSLADNTSSESDSDRFPTDDIDPAVFDDQDDDGATPTTQPPTTTPEPTTPPTQPKPPKKTPDTTAPPPPNEPPTVEKFVVTSEGGRVGVQAAVIDPEAEIASIRLILSEGDQIIEVRNVEPDAGAQRQPLNVTFAVDTVSKARRSIAVTIEVVDQAGEKAGQTAEHEVVRRTKVWVSAVSMTLNSNCFAPTRPALALTGNLVAAGLGIDSTTSLSGEFRPDKTSLILADEHFGYVDGGKAWFVLMTVAPNLTTSDGQVINLGKIQTLHKQPGSFTKTFDKGGCSGAIAYTITAELL